jgi:hypothetical protein
MSLISKFIGFLSGLAADTVIDKLLDWWWSPKNPQTGAIIEVFYLGHKMATTLPLSEGLGLAYSLVDAGLIPKHYGVLLALIQVAHSEQSYSLSVDATTETMQSVGGSAALLDGSNWVNENEPGRFVPVITSAAKGLFTK